MKNSGNSLFEVIIHSDRMYGFVTLDGFLGRSVGATTQWELDGLRRVKYNDFNGARVAKWLEKLLAKGFSVEAGRDYSPCLYIHIPHDGAPSQARTDKELALSQAVMAEGKKLKANEASVQRRVTLPEGEIKHESYVVRLWWD